MPLLLLPRPPCCPPRVNLKRRGNESAVNVQALLFHRWRQPQRRVEKYLDDPLGLPCGVDSTPSLSCGDRIQQEGPEMKLERRIQ